MEKTYHIWTNVLYFIAAIYSFIISIQFYVNRKSHIFLAFFIYSILLFLTGIFSIMYHKHMFTEEEHWSLIDQVFATLTLVYAIVFFIVTIYLRGRLFEEIFFLCVMFIILSIVFFALAKVNLQKMLRHNCFIIPKKPVCHKELVNYDIYHSNWHIYSAMAILFLLTYIKKRLV